MVLVETTVVTRLPEGGRENVTFSISSRAGRWHHPRRMLSPEQKARGAIDRLLTAAGWAVQDFKAADIHAARGVAIREFVLDAGQGFADYLLYVDGKALDKPTRDRRDWQLDDDFEYEPTQLDRSVQTPVQIRTIARKSRVIWKRDLFPQRQELSKTLVFAKDRNHP
jgi:type I site-specific restriction endonuclease